MTISEWLDQQEARKIDVSHVTLPQDLASEEEPEETIYFKEARVCSVLCTGQHPFATVERYGHWYHSRGREKDKGPHTAKPEWRLWTKDKGIALRTARQHIEG